MANQALEKQMNLLIANWTTMYTKLHNFHWYVKGHNFFTLHVKFEELYDEAAGYIDDIAERLLSIGGKPVATLRESLELATIKEAAGNETPDQMVAAIVADFEVLDKELREGMSIAEEAGDEATSDLLLGVVSTLEKHRWMLNAFLNN
ncbi:DNA starvation/stationary phase protection protein [Paenibacillus motobuensis]|uniref:Dps family protein n=1 Tax=Paenibacillus TaxID=44249 RepID=UPI002040AAB3|nr:MULTISPECIES: Dps family protein [Paenibacillus]MCM3042866.1 DNA starvation/stationary phase protection protein [Paenibacillus lutimineralis]MCM3649970.1 DNA starvation/stationary phase protection protein [Paenibacillus motobuensis]